MKAFLLPLLLVLGQLGSGQTMVSRIPDSLTVSEPMLQGSWPEAPYLSPALKEEFARGNRIVKKLLPGGIGYLRVPSMVAGPSEYNRVAQQLMDSLYALQGEGARKWVIDLRLNAAGTMLPMMAGLSPLLGNGAFLGYAQGEVVSMTRLTDGKFSSPAGGVAMVNGGSRGSGANGGETRGAGPGYSDDRASTVERKSAGKTGGTNALERASVVILTGHGTGCAGESVAIAFKGRPRTWFIGEPTGGSAGGNKGQALAGDRDEAMRAASVREETAMAGSVREETMMAGSVQEEAVTAGSVRVDRRHRVYPRNLIPDEWVPGGEDFADYGQDRKIQAAIRRLEKK